MASCEQTTAIAVIGVAGSGKSTFINLASGSNLPVSSALGGCTAELKSSTFTLDGKTVMLIDTPGFDDTAPSVLGVLKSISDHFAGPYSQGVKLAGVIYMHCTTEDYLRGASRHNFRIFSKFCGDTSLRDILIVINEPVGVEGNDDRAGGQASLDNDEIFRPAIEKGARMLCHDGSQASAHAILRRFLHREHTGPPTRGDSFSHKTDPNRATTGAAAVGQLTGQAEHHTKVYGELCQGIDAVVLAQDEKTKMFLQKEAKDSLEEMRVRYEPERVVTNVATDDSQLANENRRYKNDFNTQRAETELRIRSLEEERKARELAQITRERAEVRLAEERASLVRQKMYRRHMGITLDKLFVCGALFIFVLFCIFRYAFKGSNSLL